MRKKIAILLAAAMCMNAAAPVWAEETSAETETAVEQTEDSADGETVVLDVETPVEVTGGAIRGTLSEDGEVAIYKGIPYAAAPVGDLRWCAPQPVQEWRGVLNCENFAPCEYQTLKDADNLNLEEQPWMAPYTREFLVAPDTDSASEDCLYLNVWAKNGESQANKPVIVYIHGGGFGEGSGSIAAYDGEGMAKEGAVYVTINYRFGIFGFLTTPELDAESENGTSGNYGLMDITAALQWVQDNIEQFGGDPQNVTIVGQSAGGMAVSFMQQSPLTEGLFKNAVILSGNYIRSSGSAAITTKEELQTSFAEAYPDVTLEELREMSSEEIWENYSLSGNVCVDGYVIPNDTTQDMAEGNQNAVNLLMCCVTGDGLSFMDTTNLETTADLQAWAEENLGTYAEEALELYAAQDDSDAQAQYEQMIIDRLLVTYQIYAELNEKMGTTAYISYFSHTVPGENDCGAFHTGDVPYWLNTPVREGYWTDTDDAIAATMSAYLVNFAANVDPNGENLVQWDAYDGSCSYMAIGDDTYEMASVSEDKATFWRNYINEISLDGILTE